MHTTTDAVAKALIKGFVETYGKPQSEITDFLDVLSDMRFSIEMGFPTNHPPGPESQLLDELSEHIEDYLRKEKKEKG